MASNCYACAAPLSGDFKGSSDTYCKYCVDEKGKLKPRLDIQRGIAQWLQSWQPSLSDAVALTRADLYMRAMPAWADK